MLFCYYTCQNHNKTFKSHMKQKTAKRLSSKTCISKISHYCPTSEVMTVEWDRNVSLYHMPWCISNNVTSNLYARSVRYMNIQLHMFRYTLCCKKYTLTHTTILRLSGFCLGQSGWAGTRRNIHPLTPTVVINHPLSASASSIYHNPWHQPVQFTCLTVFFY